MTGKGFCVYIKNFISGSLKKEELGVRLINMEVIFHSLEMSGKISSGK